MGQPPTKNPPFYAHHFVPEPQSPVIASASVIQEVRQQNPILLAQNLKGNEEFYVFADHTKVIILAIAHTIIESVNVHFAI